MKIILRIPIILILLGFANLKAQSVETPSYPVVGIECPDVKLTDIYYFPKRSATLSDFKGKWLVVDFWTKDCKGCIESFPKLDSIQKTFRDSVQVIMVGVYSDSTNYSQTKKIFEYCTEKLNMQLAVAYDSVLAKFWMLEGVPYIIVVDPRGIVRAVTNEIEFEDISKCLEDKPPQFQMAYSTNSSRSYDSKKPLLVDGNGGNDSSFLYRSVLLRWNERIPIIQTKKIDVANGLFELTRVDISALYRLAYTGYAFWNFEDTSMYGNFWVNPIFELQETNLINDRYCYSICIKNKTMNGEKLRTVLQNDLFNYFGYNVKIEKRTMPVYKLTASKRAKSKLRSTSQNFYYMKEFTKFNGKKIAISDLIAMIASSISYPKQIPIIDNTGINERIDITLDGAYFEEIRKSLLTNGLVLELTKSRMNVIVVRPNQSN